MLTPGTLLGERYEIIEKIGAGGMSIVYKAKDNRLQRYVAIKELREEFVQDEEFVAKFRKEALSAASLSHPNIVGIYDVGNDRDIQYIVMEYVEGKTLKRVIDEQGPFDYKTVLELGVQMVSALKHAHQKKIIHRDIKPQNILMTNDGVLKVTDFGIAKAVDSSTIVATGNAIGSVHYFSPEQAKGKFVNQSSDLYSCGIVLFELATKRLPFEADSHISIALKHINEEFPRPSSINPNIPENLEHIILHATRKNQVERYQNADEMLRDMKGVLQSPNYKVNLDSLSEKTILLSPEETQILRESNNEELREDEMMQKHNNQDENDIYESNINFDDAEDDGEVSTFYKVLVSVGGVLATLALVVVITLACVFWIPSISKGKLYSVPNVVEKTREEAEELIKKSNLNVKVVEVETQGIPLGTVIEQDPVGGTTVKKNSTVEIHVAIGKGETPIENTNEEVKVPDLINLSIPDVTTELGKLGLLIGDTEYREDETTDENVVLNQDPVAGTTVKVGSSIKLIISKKAPKNEGIVMPNLYGNTLDEARSTLGGMNLSLGKISEEESEEEVGTIIRQTVSTGTLVDAGTRVDVIISKGKSEPEPSEEPSEEPTTEPNPDEIQQPVVDTTQSVVVLAPSGDIKESYQVVAKLSLDDGTTPTTKEITVTYDQFPVTFSFQGHGTGIVEIYIDGASVSRDTITF